MTYNPGGYEPRREPMGSPAVPISPAPQPGAYPPAYPPPPKKRRFALWVTLGVVLIAVATLGAMAGFLTLTQTAPWSGKQQAVHACEDGIRSLLKSPATARFSNVTASRSGAGGWDVSGYVDAENGFSALVRNSWDCYAEKKDGQWNGRARLDS